MKQIVITLKEGKILTYHTFFDNRPESFTPFENEERELWERKNFETQVIPRKNIAFEKKKTHAAPSVNIKEKHVNNQNP